MLPIILAATIAGSIETAVTKTLDEQPLPSRTEFEELKARVERNEKIRDSLVGCIVESLIGTSGDLLTTDLARDQCKECGEANPLGTSADMRNGLKWGQTGIEVGTCLLAAKHEHGDPSGKSHAHGKWIRRAARAAIIFNNGYAAIFGRPLVKWGVASREALTR